jgi:hypothetical protein
MLTPVVEAAAAHLPPETAAAARQQGATADLFTAVAAIQLTDETIQPPP